MLEAVYTASVGTDVRDNIVARDRLPVTSTTIRDENEKSITANNPFGWD